MVKVLKKGVLVLLTTTLFAGSVSGTLAQTEHAAGQTQIVSNTLGEAVSRIRSELPAAERKEIYIDGKPVFLIGVPTDGSLLNINRGSYIQDRVDDLSRVAFSHPDLPVIFLPKQGGTVVAVVGSKERDILTVTKEDLWILGRPTYELLQQKQHERAQEIAQSLTTAIDEGRRERTGIAVKKTTSSLLLRLLAYGVLTTSLFFASLALERVLLRHSRGREMNEGREVAIKSTLAFLRLSRVTIVALVLGGGLLDALGAFPSTRMTGLILSRGGASIAWIASGVVGSLLTIRALHAVIGSLEAHFLARAGTESRNARRARTLLPIARAVTAWGAVLSVVLTLAYLQFGMISVSLIVGGLWFIGPRWIPFNDLVRAFVILLSDLYVEGDLILRDERTMVVREVHLFHTTLETTEDSLAVKVPNGQMSEIRVLNHDGMVCVDQRYAIPYENDIDQAAQALSEVVREFNEKERCLLRREGELLKGIQEFGSTGIELRVVFWLDAERSDYISQYLRFTRSLNYAVLKNLAAVGIDIPVPEFKVHLR